MKKQLLLVVVVFMCAGCAQLLHLPPAKSSGGTNEQIFGYYPLDPLPVTMLVDKTKYLELLPDETIRIAIGTVSASGSISFSPVTIGIEGKNYVVVLDYIKFSTDSIGVHIEDDKSTGGRIATLTTKNTQVANMAVPVYIGVGLRMTANLTVKKGNVNLNSLVSLGLAAKAESISGSLIVQSLGISGPEISGLIPMPSEISESTIQNSILALASIKAKLYDSKTMITPRVVGIYNNLGGGESTINGFISSLLEERISFPTKK